MHTFAHKLTGFKTERVSIHSLIDSLHYVSQWQRAHALGKCAICNRLLQFDINLRIFNAHNNWNTVSILTSILYLSLQFAWPICIETVLTGVRIHLRRCLVFRFGIRNVFIHVSLEWTRNKNKRTDVYRNDWSIIISSIESAINLFHRVSIGCRHLNPKSQPLWRAKRSKPNKRDDVSRIIVTSRRAGVKWNYVSAEKQQNMNLNNVSQTNVKFEKGDHSSPLLLVSASFSFYLLFSSPKNCVTVPDQITIA